MLAGLDRHLKDTYGPTHPLFRCEVRREEAILQPAALQLSLVCDMFDSKAVMQQVGWGSQGNEQTGSSPGRCALYVAVQGCDAGDWCWHSFCMSSTRDHSRLETLPRFICMQPWVREFCMCAIAM